MKHLKRLVLIVFAFSLFFISSFSVFADVVLKPDVTISKLDNAFSFKQPTFTIPISNPDNIIPFHSLRFIDNTDYFDINLNARPSSPLVISSISIYFSTFFVCPSSDPFVFLGSPKGWISLLDVNSNSQFYPNFSVVDTFQPNIDSSLKVLDLDGLGSVLSYSNFFSSPIQFTQTIGLYYRFYSHQFSCAENVDFYWHVPSYRIFFDIPADETAKLEEIANNIVSLHSALTEYYGELIGVANSINNTLNSVEATQKTILDVINAIKGDTTTIISCLNAIENAINNGVLKITQNIDKNTDKIINFLKQDNPQLTQETQSFDNSVNEYEQIENNTFQDANDSISKIDFNTNVNSYLSSFSLFGTAVSKLVDSVPLGENFLKPVITFVLILGLSLVLIGAMSSISHSNNHSKHDRE